ncbi:MAG: hypothetical protein Q9174_007042 [Haloplaca sp. 1 TL-2023]
MATRFLRAAAVGALFCDIAVAIAWIGPLPTPAGLVARNGVSPRPTEAPGSKKIPKELRKRQASSSLSYPPPASLCGFVDGDVDMSSCSSSCESDDSILKCTDSDEPYCTSNRWYGGTYLYGCHSSSMSDYFTMSYLYEYYESASIGPSDPLDELDYFPYTLDDTFTGAAASSSSSSSRRSRSSTYTPYTRPTYTSSASYSSSSSSDDGLSVNAIRGIAIGVSVGVFILFMLLAIFIVRRRRAKRRKQDVQPNLPPAYTPNPAYSPGPPMQFQPSPSYQPVPQQDQSHAPNLAGYFSPAEAKDNPTVTSQSNLSPGQIPDHQQRQSTAAPSMLSPNPEQHSRSVSGIESLQRPTSTHQGMVSPMQTSTTDGSPTPPVSIFMQRHSSSNPTQKSGHNSYVAPPQGTYEAPHTQPDLGPYEMPNERH